MCFLGFRYAVAIVAAFEQRLGGSEAPGFAINVGV